MKYHLYDENYDHKGDFQTLQEMRNYLCEWKYDNNDKTYMEDTSYYFKSPLKNVPKKPLSPSLVHFSMEI